MAVIFNFTAQKNRCEEKDQKNRKTPIFPYGNGVKKGCCEGNTPLKTPQNGLKMVIFELIHRE